MSRGASADSNPAAAGSLRLEAGLAAAAAAAATEGVSAAGVSAAAAAAAGIRQVNTAVPGLSPQAEADSDTASELSCAAFLAVDGASAEGHAAAAAIASLALQAEADPDIAVWVASDWGSAGQGLPCCEAGMTPS